MAGMGPAPKDASTRSRRNATLPMTKLPSGGRSSKRAPNWPLPPDVGLQVRVRVARETAARLTTELEECDDGRTQRRLERQLEQAQTTVAVLAAQEKQQVRLERELWRDLWRTPQAALWEQMAWDRDVAQYARLKVRAELGDLNAAKEARQWSDRLGLNPLAMLRLRWQIEQTDAAEERGRRRRNPSAPPAPGASGSDPRGVLRAVK